MYQHQNEDGTPYIFNKGVDYHMAVRLLRALTGRLSIISSSSGSTCVEISMP
jgi:hypothetical protein